MPMEERFDNTGALFVRNSTTHRMKLLLGEGAAFGGGPSRQSNAAPAADDPMAEANKAAKLFAEYGDAVLPHLPQIGSKAK